MSFLNSLVNLVTGGGNNNASNNTRVTKTATIPKPVAPAFDTVNAPNGLPRGIGTDQAAINYIQANPSVLHNASGSTATPPADLSGYDQSIGTYNSQLDSLTPSLNNAIGGVNNQYQTTLNGLNQNKAQTDQVYGQNKVSNQQDWVGNKNVIKTNTGNTIGSISRLAGTRGASGQSAVDYARLLAAGQGTQQLSGASNTFAKNQQALDQNYGQYTNAYNENVKNAGLERDNGENQAKASNLSSRASLLQSLAGIVNQRTAASGGHGTDASQPYVSQAQQALAEASRLSAPRPVAAQSNLTYTAPQLASYTANPTTPVAGGEAGAQADTVTPYLSALLGRDKQLQRG
jgi:hypothetical protein